jgi:hypothetical protein
MEKDDEVKGVGNSYTTEFRQYDARLGRWLTLDPEVGKLPWQSVYCGLDNNPIIYTDVVGDIVELSSSIYTKKEVRQDIRQARRNDPAFRATYRSWRLSSDTYIIERVDSKNIHNNKGEYYATSVNTATPVPNNKSGYINADGTNTYKVQYRSPQSENINFVNSSMPPVVHNRSRERVTQNRYQNFDLTILGNSNESGNRGNDRVTVKAGSKIVWQGELPNNPNGPSQEVATVSVELKKPSRLKVIVDNPVNEGDKQRKKQTGPLGGTARIEISEK